jgi:hypothetical protein
VRDDDGSDGTKFHVIGTVETNVTEMLTDKELSVLDRRGRERGIVLVKNTPYGNPKKKGKSSTASLAEELNAQGNKLISPYTARFIDPNRESDFLHQRIFKERWGLLKKFTAMFLAATANGVFATASGQHYGPSQFVMAAAFLPVIIAVPLGASAQVIRGLTMLTNFLFGTFLLEIQVLHWIGHLVDEETAKSLNAGTNPKLLMLTVRDSFCCCCCASLLLVATAPSSFGFFSAFCCLLPFFVLALGPAD